MHKLLVLPSLASPRVRSARPGSPRARDVLRAPSECAGAPRAGRRDGGRGAAPRPAATGPTSPRRRGGGAARRDLSGADDVVGRGRGRRDVERGSSEAPALVQRSATMS